MLLYMDDNKTYKNLWKCFLKDISSLQVKLLFLSPFKAVVMARELDACYLGDPRCYLRGCY
jgi:hypothetical protein